MDTNNQCCNNLLITYYYHYGGIIKQMVTRKLFHSPDSEGSGKPWGKVKPIHFFRVPDEQY